MSENKPTTILESLQTMDGVTINRIILEAQSFLKTLHDTTVISVMKAAVGLDISFDVALEPIDKLTLVCSVREDDWKNLGKFIISAGTLVEKAGIPMKIDIKTTGGAGAYCSVQLGINVPKLLTLQEESPDDEAISVEAALAHLDPDYDSNSR